MLTFEEYQELGGVCDLTAFNSNIDRALGIVNNATYGRVSAMAVVPRSVKVCLRDIVDYIHNNNTTAVSVASRIQSAGGVSESENYNVKNADVQAQEMRDIIYDYLQFVSDDCGIPLLYRGCSR